jgi:hypothetical protein
MRAAASASALAAPPGDAAATPGVATRATEPASAATMGWTGAAGPRRSAVDGTTSIQPYSDLTGSRVAIALKRAVRRALRWYLWPLTARITTHNRAVSAVLAEHRRQIAVLRLETERVQRDAEVRSESGSRTAGS